MRALRIHGYGGADVMRIEDSPVPRRFALEDAIAAHVVCEAPHSRVKIVLYMA